MLNGLSQRRLVAMRHCGSNNIWNKRIYQWPEARHHHTSTYLQIWAPRMPLGPLGVVSLPVPVGCEVHPHLPPHEAHDAPVRHPRHPGLEVVHDAQSLDQSEMSIVELSTNPSPPWLPACSRCWRSKSLWRGTGPSPASRASRHPPSPRAGCTRAKRNWNIFYDVKYFSSHIWIIDIVDHDSWYSPVVIFLLLKEG